MVIWTAFNGSSFYVFRIVPKMIQRSVSFQLFWRCFCAKYRLFWCNPKIRTILSSSYCVAGLHEILHHFESDQELINKFLSHQFFAWTPWLGSGAFAMAEHHVSSRSLECHADIYNELLKIFVWCWRAFLPTCSVLLRMDTLDIQPQCTSSNVAIVLCEFFAEFHVTHSCLLHEFSSRPSHWECSPQVSRLLKFLF